MLLGVEGLGEAVTGVGDAFLEEGGDVWVGFSFVGILTEKLRYRLRQLHILPNTLILLHTLCLIRVGRQVNFRRFCGTVGAVGVFVEAALVAAGFFYYWD